MDDGSCSNGNDDFNFSVTSNTDTGNYNVAFNPFACDGERTTVEDFSKRDIPLVIQRLQDHPFMPNEKIRMGSAKLEFSCIVDPEEELSRVIGTVGDIVDDIGEGKFETEFSLIQTDENDVEIAEDGTYSISDQLYARASGTVVPGLVYSPVAISYEKVNCDNPACKWTFFNVQDGIAAGETCEYPGLDFSLTKDDDGYKINFRAFTLQDQVNDGNEYKYVIKVTMQYCVADSEDDTNCKRVDQICNSIVTETEPPTESPNGYSGTFLTRVCQTDGSNQVDGPVYGSEEANGIKRFIIEKDEFGEVGQECNAKWDLLPNEKMTFTFDNWEVNTVDLSSTAKRNNERANGCAATNTGPYLAIQPIGEIVEINDGFTGEIDNWGRRVYTGPPTKFCDGFGTRQPTLAPASITFTPDDRFEPEPVVIELFASPGVSFRMTVEIQVA
jgi:hypothetical protein